MPTPTDDWYIDSANIARLIRYLDQHEGIDVTICADICEKPWHWNAEYQEMLQHERDTEDALPIGLRKAEREFDAEDECDAEVG